MVDTFFVQDWDNVEKTLLLTDELIKHENDVVYPAGDGYNVHVIERMKEKGLYVIGYVSKQSDLGETTVLTSTVQHVDKLYLHAAELFNQGKLETGNLVFDFQDDVISMGKYSPVVGKSFQEKMSGWIDH
ncbi:BMP family ABC transporter substrate-binding protein [Peribacillus alkalitolerans]|uniref:BMP family ABC transporter substrate-binding protein n=1 Tax=Peribacillus alkalitolerans TaxID=1550385 RepID=UPI001F07DAA5|nr:BMP family ABC transporter substrate-binding protein [Peribacillus alkalitolerans]